MPNWLNSLYSALLTKRAYLVLLAFFAGIVLFAFQITHFRLDASSESLVLENDRSVTIYREVKKKFGSDDFLFVTFTPQNGVFNTESLTLLKDLQTQFEKIEGISSVTSILTVPLFNVPGVTLTNFGEKAYYLTPDGDLELAKAGFVENPLYQKLLVNKEATTTAMVLSLAPNDELKQLLAISAEDKARLSIEQQKNNEQRRRALIQTVDDRNRTVIETVRAILSPHRATTEAFIGGVPMIANDMITYVKSDLVVFGLSVLAFIIAVLTLIFRQFMWVVIPLLCCFMSIVVTMSFLGLMRWPVTVISSNFVSLLLIMTMSITIHLVVRYQELVKEGELSKPRDLMLATLNSMFLPCLYTGMTTMVAFGSLITSDIRPVIDFGKMMIIGVGFSFVLSFILLPLCTYLFIGQPKPAKKQLSFQKMTDMLAGFTDKHRLFIGIVSASIAIFSATGVLYLSVDNRFIDYFKPSTEIHQGMKVIDQKLGGTTPFDIVIKKSAVKLPDAVEEDDEFEDEFEDEFGEDEAFSPSVWFTPEGRELIRKVHMFLDSLNETGKVLSLWTTNELIQLLNEGEALDDFELSILQKNFPEDLKPQLLDPYFHGESEDALLSVRIIESEKNLKRADLIAKVDNFLTNELKLDKEDYGMTGMLILYNNMLSSLFDSQIKTLGTVFLAIMLMFLVLFRSFYVSMIAIIPNLLSAVFILGSMGWFNIPLDMMTITIAAITIGIAVDNTIHYIYRYRDVFAEKKDYVQTLYHCHGSIGKAMYYTSMTIIFGFSILVLSNFIPTIYFGLFTSLAMLIALLANLTLLPLMLIKLKPFGPEGQTAG